MNLKTISSPFFTSYIGKLEFLKNHGRENQDFLLKMGVGVVHVGGCLWKGEGVSTAID